ncbi:alpha/beta-hydrolase family protein [Brachybacterium rhamnosum]|uniref:Alpha/beta hydrolase n=1 Tax=Brachybacterium rhamnosum TaxID=173361 RepID=A0ABW4PTC5_9MICO
MRPGPGPSAPRLAHLLTRTARTLRSVTRATRRGVRRAEVTRPLSSGGFLGAAAAGWVATTPSMLPRTWWMWAVNIGLSQSYGYTTGVLAERLVRRGAAALGLEVGIAEDHRRRARLLGASALVGISAYSWVRGVLRQREISHLVQQRPQNLATHLVGTAAGLGASLGVLAAVRAIGATADLYRALLRPYLPTRLLGVVSLVLTLATVAVAVDRLIRGRVLEQMIEQAEAANRLISPNVPRPDSPARSGSPASHESWPSLGAPGRKIVSGGASPEVISAAIGARAMDPIRVYAGKSTSRTMEETVQAVLAELDRTGAWDREVLVLFTGTGTGWLQEWSLSAIEFLTAGDCATASMQYSVYTSGLSYVVDRRSPKQAGRLLFQAVRRRLDAMEPASRPRLFVAGESLGSFGGQAAFRDLPDLLAKVDGAVWTGTPSFTPLWQQVVARSRPGSPAIAPIIDQGRHVRVVTRPRDLHRNYWGGLYEPWRSPRVVYAQHPSDPVAWWRPSLLWEEPDWLRERVGHDVTPAMRWSPWITFWQVALDMPLSVRAQGGHGHSYREEMVPIWAAVLGQDVAPGGEHEQRRRHERIVRAIREVARG